MRFTKNTLIKEARKHGYSDLYRTPSSLRHVFDWIEKRPAHTRESHREIACMITNYFSIKVAKESLRKLK